MTETVKEDKIIVDHVSKVFNMYNSPVDKLKEAFSPTGKVRHTEFHALTDLSFRVKKGEILGIMGRNGAGKSTLLKIITGILEPTAGKVDVSGRISSLLELGTGFNMEYTGIANIYFYGTLMGFTKQQMDKKLDDIIRFAEIGDYIDQVVKTYSSGMFARLAFSCAINVEPEILIVDEILSVGDMRFQAKCFNKFKEFKKQGVTILYVGHDVGMMRTFCDRCMWLNDGKLVAEGDPTYITAQFTEFMYLDDTSDFTLYKKFSEDKQETQLESTPEQREEKEEVQKGETEDGDIEKQEIKAKPKVSENSRFQNCLAHWGTNVGLVTSVRMLGEDGQEKNYFDPYEKMKIEICFKDMKDFDHKNFSVAFSIKNKEGTDLCVKTTYDENIFIGKAEEHKVVFEFQPMLAKGEYYLVVALENRENMNPTYFEYIEGACYFKVFSDKKIFGVYDVNANIFVD